MFTSEKQATHLQSFKSSGDADQPSLDLKLYITPLTYELAYEISDRIAKQLYRREGTNHVPVHELDDPTLILGELPPYNLELFPHAEADGAGQMIAGCRIGKVQASKLFPDNPDWSLVFTVTAPMDSNSIALAHKYYRKTLFLTLVESQKELFETDDKKPIILDDATVESGKDILCVVCNARASYLAADQAGYCDEHVSAAVGVQVRRVKYTVPA